MAEQARAPKAVSLVKSMFEMLADSGWGIVLTDDQEAIMVHRDHGVWVYARKTDTVQQQVRV